MNLATCRGHSLNFCHRAFVAYTPPSLCGSPPTLALRFEGANSASSVRSLTYTPRPCSIAGLGLASVQPPIQDRKLFAAHLQGALAGSEVGMSCRVALRLLFHWLRAVIQASQQPLRRSLVTCRFSAAFPTMSREIMSKDDNVKF